jgi:hypothetical protein
MGPAAPVIAVIRKGSDFGHAAQDLFGPGAGGPSTSNGVESGTETGANPVSVDLPYLRQQRDQGT